MGGQDRLPRNLWLTAWVGKGASPTLQEPAFDREQHKLISELFTGSLDMRNLAQLHSLTHRCPIACPQLDALHGPPPGVPRIAWFLCELVLRRQRVSMSTFPQRRCCKRGSENEQRHRPPWDVTSHRD